MSREVQLASTPVGLPTPENFVVADTAMPIPEAGQVLVRNRFFQVSARLRTLIAGGVEGAPLPAVRPGDTFYSATIGEIVSAPDGSGLRPGALVRHWLGWREYAVLAPTDCIALDDTLPDPVAFLSEGWTAYVALTRYAPVRAGDMVLVTGATGAVGSLAGQIARQLGATRVIGTTGFRTKADRLVAELGYDRAILRGDAFADQLAKAAPDGVDVVLDTVGGSQLRAAVDAARPGARVVLVGTLAGQLSGSGTTAPVELDTFPLILKGISLRGWSDPNDPAAQQAWTALFGDWLRSGAVTFPYVRVAGLDGAAQALCEVISGQHLGTVVVEVQPRDENR